MLFCLQIILNFFFSSGSSEHNANDFKSEHSLLLIIYSKAKILHCWLDPLTSWRNLSSNEQSEKLS